MADTTTPEAPPACAPPSPARGDPLRLLGATAKRTSPRRRRVTAAGSAVARAAPREEGEKRADAAELAARRVVGAREHAHAEPEPDAAADRLGEPAALVRGVRKLRAAGQLVGAEQRDRLARQEPAVCRPRTSRRRTRGEGRRRSG